VYATYAVMCSADNVVEDGVLYYSKIPSEGVVYSFYEDICEKPLVRHIQVMKHEELCFFIAKHIPQGLYHLQVRDGNGII
jgi:hypothetical protein